MKKVNLNKEKINVSSQQVLQALNTKKEFIITLDGQIKFEFEPNEIKIFQGRFPQAGMLGATPTLKSVLGEGYIVKFDSQNNLFEINCAGAWQRIATFNVENATYEDAGEGINEFDDKELEDMGWHATEFDVSYRQIVEVIESSGCDMLMLCSEIEEGETYFFNGLGFVEDMECVRTKVREYIVTQINEKLVNAKEFSKEYLEDDHYEALEYFNIAI
jgi:hypothetical protein